VGTDNGDLKTLDLLRYDVTSVAAQLRSGGTGAIIGVCGGRDVLNCAAQGFRRIASRLRRSEVHGYRFPGVDTLG